MNANATRNVRHASVNSHSGIIQLVERGGCGTTSSEKWGRGGTPRRPTVVLKPKFNSCPVFLLFTFVGWSIWLGINRMQVSGSIPELVVVSREKNSSLFSIRLFERRAIKKQREYFNFRFQLVRVAFPRVL